MKHTEKYFDEKNRPVKEVITKNGREKYYIGPDAEGSIQEDEEGNEYIEVDGERRYWRGIIESVPDDDRLERLPVFSFGFLKPDVKERGLRRDILAEINSDLGVDSHKTFQFNPELVYKMYPHFYEELWEEALLKYLCSGMSLAFLVFGKESNHKLGSLRDNIREKYRNPDLHPVVNLIHVADTPQDSLREALLLYEIDELVGVAREVSGF